jgi:PKHD-type hydroxylase
MLKNSYWIWDKVLSKDFCNLILAETNWSKQELGKVGSMKDACVIEKQRITNIVWAEVMSPIWCVAYSYITSANQQAGWNYEFNLMENVQIGHYAKNGHYDWHTDLSAPNNEGIQRKLSMSIQLNDPSKFKGGKLEFKTLPDKEQPKMQQGSIVVFPSFLEHRVTPVTSGNRYSAVTWASGPAFR